MSSTSSSRRAARTVAPPCFAVAPAAWAAPRPRSSATKTLPVGRRTRPGSGGPTRAGARCTRARCSRATGSRSSPSSPARTGSCPSRTASSARSASGFTFTYHWSVSRARSRRPSGRRAAPCGRAARSASSSPRSSSMRDDALARLEAVEAVAAPARPRGRRLRDAVEEGLVAGELQAALRRRRC